MRLRLLTMLATLSGVAVCTSAASAALTRSVVAPYLHPQRLVDVGGHKLNVYCTGHGSPTVILDAGQAQTTFSWRKVQPKISKFARVCSFDRAGMGFSEAGPLPRDANAMVTDLHALLQRANIAPPYVLVGHSFASLFALLYADRYLPDVAGMVLVDPSFPNQQEALHAASPTMKRMEADAPRADEFCYQAALHGKLGLKHGAKAYELCGFPANVAADVRTGCAKFGAAWCDFRRVTIAQYVRPSFWSAYTSEDMAFYKLDSAEDIRAQRDYGSMPLIVLTAANDDGDTSIPAAEMRAVNDAWKAGHDRLARLSSIGVNRVIRHAGHDIELDQPAVVTTAVAEVVHRKKR